jgi:hypothetical protein
MRNYPVKKLVVFGILVLLVSSILASNIQFAKADTSTLVASNPKNAGAYQYSGTSIGYRFIPNGFTGDGSDLSSVSFYLSSHVAYQWSYTTFTGSVKAFLLDSNYNVVQNGSTLDVSTIDWSHNYDDYNYNLYDCVLVNFTFPATYQLQVGATYYVGFGVVANLNHYLCIVGSAVGSGLYSMSWNGSFGSNLMGMDPTFYVYGLPDTTPSPSPSPTVSPTSSPSPSPTPTASPSPSPTPTVSPSPSPSPSATHTSPPSHGGSFPTDTPSATLIPFPSSSPLQGGSFPKGFDWWWLLLLIIIIVVVVFAVSRKVGKKGHKKRRSH